MRLVVPLLPMLLAACYGSVGVAYYDEPDPVPVSIEVEVYEPSTNRVWVNVGVRIVDAYNEWSDDWHTNPNPQDWRYTDDTGVARFSAHAIADANVGFKEDGYGQAVLDAEPENDEATVTLEIWAPGHEAVIVRVDLCWCYPYAWISVPFQ
jgi:hypothetical protein